MKRTTALSLRGRRLAVCLGPGGVGKTTISAALAVRAAIDRLAVDVMTVDPAPRLLDSLGLDAANSDPQPVTLDGIAPRGARLRAFKLDPKRTFDELVGRYAPSDAARSAILANRLYRNLSDALAGVGDYMAMEKLLELIADRSTDLVVLDTPPAREALDFLDAPRRLLELLGSRAATLLGAKRGFLGQRLTMLDLAARAVLGAFDRLTGLQLLGDVKDFVRSFDGMYQGFAERAERAQAMLRDERTLIAMVTTAEHERVDEARRFIEALRASGLRVDALIVNRVLPEVPAPSVLARLDLPSALKRKLARNLREFAALKRRESNSLGALRDALGAGGKLLIAPDLGREPRGIKDLAEIATQIAVPPA